MLFLSFSTSNYKIKYFIYEVVLIKRCVIPKVDVNKPKMNIHTLLFSNNIYLLISLKR